MPIRPENRARYPKDWKTVVVPRIRARSGNRCECTGQCGHQHPRERHGEYMDQTPRCSARNGMPIDEIKGSLIVLTVAHLNHIPEDCRDENLLHMCQRCHNAYDAPMRAAGIRSRNHARNAIGDLFQCLETVSRP